MPLLIEYLPLTLQVMHDPHLRVRTRGNSIKTPFAKIERNGQTFEDILAELEALGVELFEGRFEAWQLVLRWTA